MSGGAIPATPQDANAFVRSVPDLKLAAHAGAAGSNLPPSTDTIYAVEEIRRMRGGSQSHLMRCSDGNYYVVKFQNNPQHRRVLVNEFLGTKLAALLGLSTAAVAIIEVSEDLIRLTPELCMELPRRHIPCRQGPQFGSRYLADPHRASLMEVLPTHLLSAVENLNEFIGMLVFDKWTCNTDGRQAIFGRPTVTANYHCWMIDQGFCFNAGEWTFPDAPLRSLYRSPKVYEQVQGIESFELWLGALESKIDAQLLLTIAKTIPPEWYEFDSESLRRLLEQLDFRRARVRELLRSARMFSPHFFPNWTEENEREGDSNRTRNGGCKFHFGTHSRPKGSKSEHGTKPVPDTRPVVIK